MGDGRYASLSISPQGAIVDRSCMKIVTCVFAYVCSYPVEEVIGGCLNQMNKVINDYLYINEIMSFRAIQHLFTYILILSFAVAIQYLTTFRMNVDEREEKKKTAFFQLDYCPIH